ncbi:peptidylprolyl isomerase [Candidatus Nitrotoga sp. M5]|uniref:peptidylprolyl isomerase n=1 Tax=Candidatus Nitrotoga sp. M5 TaxID=2890409 RepID=UPI001EF2644A|nr:peptidylprolyl isomerase [Candidatus Nitrotoga sp. M5]CAH1386500.1 Peptidyl-prolyl cis-trans isomerase ppiD [Candidatus Nitrotoga sp. M5]
MRQLLLKQCATLAVMVCFTAPALSVEQVLVESNQVRITNLDFEADLMRIPSEHRSEVLASKSRIAKLLESILINKTLAAQARDAGIDREPVMSKQMDMAADKLLAQEQINRITKEVKLPNFDARARELYKVNIDKYTVPTKVHVSHILVDTKSRTQEEAQQRIKQVREQAVGGKEFEALALEYSDDPSAKGNKGDLGFFEKGKMVKPFSDAAFAITTPGDISEPVKTVFGYHIIQLHEKTPKQVRSYEEVKEEIIQVEREKFLNEYRKTLIGKILLDPSLKLNEEAVNRFWTNPDMKLGDVNASEKNKSEATKQ